MKDCDLKYVLGLAKVEGLGAKRLKQLFSYFSSPEEIWYASVDELKRVEGIGDYLAKKLYKSKHEIDLDYELNIIKQANVQVLLENDGDYPQKLKDIYSPPSVLFCKGKLDLLKLPALGIIGTRNPTRYGYEVLKKLIPGLCEAGVVVLSGLARGIDGMAHKICLECNGNTIAVLGCGLDQVYPPEHNRLYKSISQQGLLVTEYPLGSVPAPGNFPARNRIISGIATAILIVEAPKKSGTMITAEFALEQNKEVLVVPGNITNPKSRGCNELLSQGAKPVLEVDDILEEFENIMECYKITDGEGETVESTSTVSRCSETLKKIPYYPYTLHLEELLADSSLKYEVFIQEILELELSGHVIRQVGGYISRIK